MFCHAAAAAWLILFVIVVASWCGSKWHQANPLLIPRSTLLPLGTVLPSSTRAQNLDPLHALHPPRPTPSHELRPPL
jgi:hypothetical protein